MEKYSLLLARNCLFFSHKTTVRIVSCSAFVYLTMSFIFFCTYESNACWFKCIDGLHCGRLCDKKHGFIFFIRYQFFDDDAKSAVIE